MRIFTRVIRVEIITDINRGRHAIAHAADFATVVRSFFFWALYQDRTDVLLRPLRVSSYLNWPIENNNNNNTNNKRFHVLSLCLCCIYIIMSTGCCVFYYTTSLSVSAGDNGVATTGTIIFRKLYDRNFLFPRFIFVDGVVFSTNNADVHHLFSKLRNYVETYSILN